MGTCCSTTHVTVYREEQQSISAAAAAKKTSAPQAKQQAKRGNHNDVYWFELVLAAETVPVDTARLIAGVYTRVAVAPVHCSEPTRAKHAIKMTMSAGQIDKCGGTFVIKVFDFGAVQRMREDVTMQRSQPLPLAEFVVDKLPDTADLLFTAATNESSLKVSRLYRRG